MGDDKRRAGTVHGDRNESRVWTPASGVSVVPAPTESESWEGADGLTPIGDLLPDPIEVAAVRIEQRAEAIRDRPGPTPPPEALQSAITIHGVRAELHELKRDVKEEFTAVHRKVDGVADIVVKGMVKELDMRRETDHLVMRQRTEVGAASDIAKLEVDAAKQKTAEAKKKASAETRSKAINLLFAGAAFVMALLEARHC